MDSLLEFTCVLVCRTVCVERTARSFACRGWPSSVPKTAENSFLLQRIMFTEIFSSWILCFMNVVMHLCNVCNKRPRNAHMMMMMNTVTIVSAICAWWQQIDRSTEAALILWYAEWPCSLGEVASLCRYMNMYSYCTIVMVVLDWSVVWRHRSAAAVWTHAETASVESVRDSSYGQRTLLLGRSVSQWHSMLYCLQAEVSVANFVLSLAVKENFENRLIFPEVIDTSRVSFWLTLYI